jgi:hypothetical protein
MPIRLVVVPSTAVLLAFNTHIQPWYDRIVAGKCESRTLAATRDLLLSKFMSGEIRLKDAEKALAEVARARVSTAVEGSRRQIHQNASTGKNRP